jgi:nitrous oxidase accessory protein
MTLARRVLVASALSANLAFTLLIPGTASAGAGARTGADAGRLVVSPAGPYTTVQAALADARDGDLIEVRAGQYHGPLLVDKAVTLQGDGMPSIDNGGEGTVVTLAKAGAALRGFEVRGSGVEPDQDHAGITLAAPDTLAEGNRLYDVLFGIYLAGAPGAVARGNDITSKAEYDVGRKGDGIRLWESPRAVVEGNTVHESRDVVIWYSEQVVIRDNTIEHGRYGIHLMYCNGAHIEHNRLLDNSVGIYTMYSDDTVLRDNLIRGQRGPSGYALGFKDSADVEVLGNVLVDNRAGLFLDNTPFGPSQLHVSGNTLAFNDVGVMLLTDTQGGQFTGNTFWENEEQVAIQGGGAGGKNEWQGNYWSDYTGFDANGDGTGDVPYHAERLFENLLDRVPPLRALIYSPAAQAVELAAAAFPIMRPLPKLTDAAPLTQPPALPAFALPAQGGTAEMAVAAALLLGCAVLCAALALSAQGGTAESKTTRKVTPMTNQTSDDKPHEPATLLRVSQVTKRYGRQEVLHDMSFDVARGEALALWGPNGAGKTTLLKSILGLVDYRGTIQVDGHDARRAGKQARREIGYVPQEVAFYDWSVSATMAFYATLKKADHAHIAPLLERMGLTTHRHKTVPALSGGLKQRLTLAIALLGDPPILLLDEPMANLDAQARAEYRDLLAGLHREGKTILFASHRLEEVETLADRVLVLEQGMLKAALPSQALRGTLSREVDMVLWIPAAQRSKAVSCLAREGMPAHMNGHGTVVARVDAEHKLHLLHTLSGSGVEVLDFELVPGRPDTGKRQA